MMREGLRARPEYHHASDQGGAFLTTADELARRKQQSQHETERVGEFVVKRDAYGLGYVPAQEHRLRDEVSQLREQMQAAPQQRVTIGQALLGTHGSHAAAFGLGALEEQDGDIDDVYDQGSCLLHEEHAPKRVWLVLLTVVWWS